MPFWNEYTIKGFAKAREETSVAVMVTGALEAHGEHGPLGTDTMLPEYLAKAVAEKTKALVLPTIPFGDSWYFNQFNGTVSVAPKTLIDFYISIMKGVFKQGFRYIIVINGHDGNTSHLATAAKKATMKGERVVIIVDWWRDLAKDARKITVETPAGHAAEDETSEIMYVKPHLVDMSEAKAARVVTRFKLVSAQYRKDLYPSALFGDPRKASADKGKLIMEQAEEELIELINQVEKGKLPYKDEIES
ncbi:MAG: creatininase family protein [Candidatus Thorarchaeota archaeon]